MVTEIKTLLTIIIKKGLYFITAIGVFLIPIQEILLGVGVLIFIDLILGIMAARKEGEKITSNKLSQTLIKMFVYHLLIISAFLIEQLLVSYIPFLQLTLVFLSVTEFTSISENFTRISGINFIKFIRTRLNEYLKKHSK